MQPGRARLDAVNRHDLAETGDDRVLGLVDRDEAASQASKTRHARARQHQPASDRRLIDVMSPWHRLRSVGSSDSLVGLRPGRDGPLALWEAPSDAACSSGSREESAAGAGRPGVEDQLGLAGEDLGDRLPVEPEVGQGGSRVAGGELVAERVGLARGQRELPSRSAWAAFTIALALASASASFSAR